jgi:hypothetical protein
MPWDKISVYRGAAGARLGGAIRYNRAVAAGTKVTEPETFLRVGSEGSESSLREWHIR